MRFEKIPETTFVFPLGQPRFHEGNKNEAVLLVHGHRGLAGEFSYIFDRMVREGYTVSLPRLPGHGTNRYDFHESDYRDWLRCVTDEYLNLKSRCEKVYIAGLSMGGVLALLLAERFQPDKIALLAPAMAVRNKGFYAAPFIKYFVKSIQSTWTPEDEESEERKALGREYWESYDTAKLHDLIILQKMAGKKLRDVSSPTLTIVSLADKTVPPEVAEAIEGKIRSREKKRVVLEKSPHVLVDGCEKERVADEVIAWFKESLKDND
jgi:carboxylesterase